MVGVGVVPERVECPGAVDLVVGCVLGGVVGGVRGAGLDEALEFEVRGAGGAVACDGGVNASAPVWVCGGWRFR